MPFPMRFSASCHWLGAPPGGARACRRGPNLCPMLERARTGVRSSSVVPTRALRRDGGRLKIRSIPAQALHRVLPPHAKGEAMPTTDDTISKTVGQVSEITVIAPLKPGSAGKLRQVLNALQTTPDS